MIYRSISLAGNPLEITRCLESGYCPTERGRSSLLNQSNSK